MHNLVPRLIQQKMAQGERNGRFVAVALFIDTSGSTALSAKLIHHGKAGTEALANILRAVFEPLVNTVYAYGGFIAGFAGDGFKAIFPDLTATSHVAALAAAEAIRHHMAHNAEHHTPFGTFHFAVRASIAAGDITWSIWSAAADAALSQSSAYTFSGEAIDQAVRGEEHAQAGDIILTPAVAQAIRPFVQTVPLTDAAAGYERMQALLGQLPATPTPVPPPLVTAVATRFFPKALLTHSLWGEFRQVVSLFINLQHLPEADADDPFMPTFFRLLEQYGGYLCRIGRIGARDSGGTFLIFWGAPLSHENDVERALNFVLALQAQSSHTFRAGLTYGTVYAGFVGAALREEYTCYALSVNIAARLMATAVWGDIWLDSSIVEHSQSSQHHIDFVADMPFKGIAGHRPVFQLLPGEGSSQEPFYRGKLVGRQAELAALETAVQPIRNGRFGGIITITGEAGIGKSRLVHEFLEKSAVLDNAELFLCQTDEIQRQSLNPFRYLLRHLFNQYPLHDPTQNRAHFDAVFDELLAATAVVALRSELSRLRPFLAALINLHWDNSLYEQVDAKLRFENSLMALKTLIKAESQRQPIILYLEDIHWLDHDSVTLISRLTRNVSAYPFIIIATTRPGTSLPFTLDDDVPQTHIALDALTASDIDQIATTHLQGQVAPSLSQLLVKRADGNPFFAEQIVLYLQEHNFLVNGAAGWQLKPGTSTEAVLSTDVQTVLIARLDQLTQRVRQTVQTAAVLGREFSVQVLSQMLKEDTAVIEQVRTAETAAIWSALSDLHYLFKHTLLREVAYEMQLQAQRRQLHQIAAAAIETLFADNLAAYYADLAYHYHHSQQTQPEQTYAKLAGQQALDRFALAEAVTLFDQALAVTDQNDVSEQIELLLKRVKTHHFLSNQAEQAADLARLQQLAATQGSPQQQAMVLLQKVDYGLQSSRYEMATEAAQQAVALTETHHDTLNQMRAYAKWGQALWPQGQYAEAQAMQEKALALAHAANLPDMQAHALVGLGIAFWGQGRYEAARDAYNQSLALYEQKGTMMDKAAVYTNLGLVAQSLGEHDKAEAYLEEAIQINRRIGARHKTAISLTNLGLPTQNRGEYERAIAIQEEAQEVFREVGDGFGQFVTVGSLGAIANELGQYDRALRYRQEALTHTQQIGNVHGESLVMTALGETLYFLGDLAAAQTHLETAVAIAQTHSFPDGAGKALTQLGFVRLADGQSDAAAAALSQALAIRQSLNQTKGEMEVLAGLTAVAHAQGELAMAQRHAETILTFLQTNTLDSVAAIFHVYLILYRLLYAVGDARAAAVLTQANHILQQRASQLSNADHRRSFLEDVAVNRQLVALLADG